MTCLYYLAPTLESTQRVTDDLHAAGVKDFFLHVISKDESGLAGAAYPLQQLPGDPRYRPRRLHRAAFGFIAGLIGAALLHVLRAVRS